MKKTIRIMLALALVIAALSVSVSAAGTNGFYDIGSATDVTITPYAGADKTAVTSKEANVDATDDTAEVYYEGSDRFDVAYAGATANANYGVILVEGSSLPTSASAIYYIDQVKAEGTSVDFNVYPATITAPSETDNNRDMTLYISSDVEGAELVSVPMAYVVGYKEVVTPSFIYGDVNGDEAHTNMDKTWLAKRIVGGYDADIVGFVEDAADVLFDGELNNRDKTVLARWLVGGYYESLPVAPEDF